MDRVDIGVGKKLFIVAGSALDRQLICEPASLLRSSGGDPCNFDVAEAADSFRMDAAHEARTENGGPDLFHETFLATKTISIMCETAPNKICIEKRSASNLHGDIDATANMESGPMVVKMRFSPGPVVSRRSGKNSRLATLAANVLALVSIICGSLALWRIGADLDWAGDFVFSRGLLSHWQVWMGAALAVQYLGWRLNRYSQKAIEPEPGIEPVEESPAKVNVIAHV